MAGHQQMLLGVAPPAPPPGGSLAIVQSPDPTLVFDSNPMQQTLTAVVSGNAVVMMVRSPTAGGAPTVADSGGGSWGAVRYSYDDPNGQTVRWYARANITEGITWVRATFGGNVSGYIAAIEVSGAGSAITLDASGNALQSAATLWETPFTSTSNDVLLITNFSLSNNAAPTGVPPLTAVGVDGNYATYGYGIFPTAGSNTGQINLADSRSGDKSWAVFRAGA